MLALAHGAKGIMFFWFDSGEQEQNNGHCVGHYWDCIVDENAVPRPDSIYYTIKDNLVPRLKGTLGNTLMNLDYTGNYINVAYDEGIPPEGSSYSFDYLNIQHYGMHYHWHAGFLTQKNQPDNKHFLLTNLRTYSVESKLIVSNNTEYKNVSFTDIEGGVDTTIGYNSSITYYETMPAGEGKLYRVSPVILYGGRLLYDEYAGEDLVLTDDMIIENGKTLSISGNYFADGNIIIKNGSIVNYENGKIQFANGKKLIIEGAATISGIPDDKLILDFVL